ncbi:MAG: hypothetical protein M1821_006212 [Bathelium mastoideum]|nr:MAG: hypothetical protein M1821_006212 [Bathelium mastoideum]
MSDEPRKRSRFDQTEPEPRRPSRFDRRSRSPAPRSSETRRSRSPARDTESPTSASNKNDAAAAAAAAAAKINAQINAKKGIQHVDVPPIRSPATPATAKSPSAGADGSGEVYTQDGDYIKDIEVNDLRNRYTLTKGSTQKMIKEDTGADVTTRGSYYPDKSMATAANPPLYLHVTSTTKDGLEKAISKINELMQQELPNLVDERRFRRREPEQFERDEMGRRKWPEERIPIDLEPIPGFNLRAQVVGHGGSYVKHIQQETRCRVQIKGRGSGFIERDGNESDEQMYLHVAGPDAEMVKRAAELCVDLLKNVKSQYEAYKERGPSQRSYSGSGGYNNGGYNNNNQDRGSYGGGYGNNYGGAQSPNNPTTPGTPNTAQSDYAAQYAAWAAANPGQDPYAAYGGYQNYCNMYYQWYQSQEQQGGQQTQQQAGAPPAAPGEAPPPPPSSAPPPPPPGASSSPGGYNAVPPPPGM